MPYCVCYSRKLCEDGFGSLTMVYLQLGRMLASDNLLLKGWSLGVTRKRNPICCRTERLFNNYAMGGKVEEAIKFSFNWEFLSKGFKGDNFFMICASDTSVNLDFDLEGLSHARIDCSNPFLNLG